MIEGLIAGVGSVGLIIYALTCKRQNDDSAVEELSEPTPPAQGAYRTAGQVGSWPETVAEASYPDIASECPACGVSLRRPRCGAGHFSNNDRGQVCSSVHCYKYANELALELIFCHAGQQIKGCKTQPPHLHQNCRRCGWQGLARTRKVLKQCTE